MSKSKKKKHELSEDSEWDAYFNDLNSNDAELAENILKQDDHSIQNSINRLEETKHIGQKALDQLEQQGEQLKGLDKDLKKTRRQNEKNRKNLNKINSCFGGIKNLFTSCCHPTIEDEEWQPKPADPELENPYEEESIEEDSLNLSTPLFDLYKKTDKGLNKIGNLTNELQVLALKIQNTLNFEDKILDQVLKDADKALKEMRANNRQAAQM